MKKYLLFWGFTIFLSAVTFANDTLTRAQVYDFAVGDTFDYASTGGFAGFYTDYIYTRKVVKGKYYSPNNDSLYIVFETKYPITSIDTLGYDSLQAYEIFLASNVNCFNYNYVIDTGTSFNGHKFNEVGNSCLDFGYTQRFADGLGEVYFYSSNRTGPDEYTTTQNLIYYSNGTERWGAPLFGGTALLKYTPIPEECAIWTANVYDDYPPPPFNHVAIKEQIRSGNRIAHNGHAYVEMVYRSFDLRNGQFTTDSLIGYYRNDTTNKKALFYQSLQDTAFLEYDFNYVCVPPHCMTQVTVGGQLRTKWPDYIEGVGGINGFVPVKQVRFNFPPGSPFFIERYAELTGFCVCGQLLYGSDPTACGLLTGVDELSNPRNPFQLFPNPTSSAINIVIEESLINSTLIITDLTGRTLIKAKLTSAKTQLSTEALPKGLYFVTAGTVTQKLVISK